MKTKMLSILIIVFMIISMTLPIVKADDKTESEIETPEPHISYYAYIEKQGWETEFIHKDGETAGTTGAEKAIEAINIKVEHLPEDVKLKYRVHSSNIGWQNWLESGKQAGIVNKKSPIEAIQIELENSKEYSIEYRAHVAYVGWQSWVKDGELAGTTGESKAIEAIEIKITKRTSSVVYKAYVQNTGWQNWMANGKTAGTTGQGKAIYSLNMDVVNFEGIELQYQAHVSDIGWMNWTAQGNEVGSKEKNKSIEAIKIKIKDSKKYVVSYRAHVSNVGWQSWVKDGELAGTSGKAQCIEAIEIKIIERPASIAYQAHVRDIGWQNWKYNGELAGTTSKAKSIEALKIDTINYDGLELEYQAHVSNIGWQSWVTNGQLAGTTGKGYPIEALKIKVKNSDKYSVRYRAHVANVGWQSWCLDGEMAGTTGQSNAIEAIQINIIPKEYSYGKSGLLYQGDSRGSRLQYYKFGDGPNVLFATFAVHGFEDKWNNDGAELVTIANNFYNTLKNGSNQDIAQKWTVYIFPEVNPDGRRHGWTHNGPGRTSLYSLAPGHQGVDINRCWQIDGVPYTLHADARNYNGTAGFQSYEAQALKDFLLENQSHTGQTILIDLHGWTNQLIGDENICNTYYYSRFPNADRSALGRYGDGYLVNWARSTLHSSTTTARSALIELPSSGINNHNDVLNQNLSGRYIEATLDMLRNISVPSSKARTAMQNVSSTKNETKNITQEEQYKIAIAGMIKQAKPEENEIETLVTKEPQENGIWIEKSSRESFLKLINENANCKYIINDEGYLKINEVLEKNKYDELLVEMINASKIYAISQTGQYCSRDYMTKTIENNPFEKMDEYQIYHYVVTDDKMAMILTSNTKNKLTDTEILDSLVKLLKQNNI